MDIIGHIVLAIVLQWLVARLTGNWLAGAMVASAWAISREITQAEYRWIEHFGGGLRANMPWWGGLDPAVWQKADPWLDWIVPTLLTVAIALAARRKKSSPHQRGFAGPVTRPRLGSEDQSRCPPT